MNIDPSGIFTEEVPSPHVGARVLVPYFIGTSIPAPHIGAKITGSGFANSGYGTPTLETWKFSLGDTLQVGQATVGNVVLTMVEADTRLPVYNSVVYAFGIASPPKIYCFGMTTKWGVPLIRSVITDTDLASTAFGAAVVGPPPVLQIKSTRSAPPHTAANFRFGYDGNIYADPFVATKWGVARAANSIYVLEVTTGGVGDPCVTRYAPPALRVRDARNVTVKYDVVPFQFGYPKYDIFPQGVRPTGFGRSNVRGVAQIEPAGFVATEMWNWSMPWVQEITQRITWELSSGYAGYPMTPTFGTTVLNNTGQHGIRPIGFIATGFAGTSINNVEKSVHPYHGLVDVFSNVIDNVHTEFGAASAAVDPTYIPPQRIYPDPFTEVFRDDDRVWHVEPRLIGPIGLGQTEVGEFVQCVLLDPDFYSVQGFRDDTYGYPEVERIANIRPTNWDTLWGAPQVTHYTRSVYPFQPLTSQIIGNAYLKRTILPASIASTTAFGDVHQWHENTIQLRPWDVPTLGIPRIASVVTPAGVSGEYVPAPSMVEPIYAWPFWATVMGDNPSVVYGDATNNCGQLPRAVVPKGFAITQFGDFDARL